MHHDISCFLIRIRRPSEHTLLWCGAREDLSDLNQKDKEFAWWTFSSCTTSMSVLEAPNYLRKTGTGTIFSIQISSEKDIRAHSFFTNEGEILLPPGIYLTVIDSVSRPDCLHIIHLREISSPPEMLEKPFERSKLKTALSYFNPLLNLFKGLTKQKDNTATNDTQETAVQASSKLGKLNTMIFTIITSAVVFQQQSIFRL